MSFVWRLERLLLHGISQEPGTEMMSESWLADDSDSDVDGVAMSPDDDCTVSDDSDLDGEPL